MGKLNELKRKLSGALAFTGAAALTGTTVTIAALPLTAGQAKADVPVDRILGELQIDEDRTDIKL